MIKKLKLKNIILMYFQIKKTLKNNRYYTLKHPLKKLMDLMLIWLWFVLKAKPFLLDFGLKKYLMNVYFTLKLGYFVLLV